MSLSFNKIFDLTAGVYFYFFNILYGIISYHTIPNTIIPEVSGIISYHIKKMQKYTSAVRSTKKVFDQNSILQAACDTSIARVTGCVYPREGYSSVTPLLMPG